VKRKPAWSRVVCENPKTQSSARAEEGFRGHVSRAWDPAAIQAGRDRGLTYIFGIGPVRAAQLPSAIIAKANVKPSRWRVEGPVRGRGFLPPSTRGPSIRRGRRRGGTPSQGAWALDIKRLIEIGFPIAGMRPPPETFRCPAAKRTHTRTPRTPPADRAAPSAGQEGKRQGRRGLRGFDAWLRQRRRPEKKGRPRRKRRNIPARDSRTSTRPSNNTIRDDHRPEGGNVLPRGRRRGVQGFKGIAQREPLFRRARTGGGRPAGNPAGERRATGRALAFDGPPFLGPGGRTRIVESGAPWPGTAGMGRQVRSRTWTADPATNGLPAPPKAGAGVLGP